MLRNSLRHFSTQGIKTLRETTGAPLVDCKRALTENNGDLELAKKWLFEKSKLAKDKLAARSTKQGLIGLLVEGHVAAIAEVQCETDFVASLDDFQQLVQAQTLSVLKASPLPADLLTSVVGKVRENMILGQSIRCEKQAGEEFGSYIHNNIKGSVGSSGAVVTVKNGSKDLAKQLAIHLVGLKPQFITKDQVPQEEVLQETARLMEESATQFAGKSENAKKQIVASKLNKFFAEKCLMEQTFAFGEFEGKLVKDVLGKNASVSSFIRLAVGENALKA